MKWVFVALGGALGAMSRFGVNEMSSVLGHAHSGPLATFFVNIVGSLVMGFLVGFFRDQLSPEVQSFVLVGFIGSFTTFSTFTLDVVSLAQGKSAVLALIYLVTSVVFGVLSCWLGLRMATALR